jgi:hypothetical protein
MKRRRFLQTAVSGLGVMANFSTAAAEGNGRENSTFADGPEQSRRIPIRCRSGALRAAHLLDGYSPPVIPT